MRAKPPNFVLMNLRVPPYFKALAEKRAAEQGLKLSGYIRNLIAADLGVKPPTGRRDWWKHLPPKERRKMHEIARKAWNEKGRRHRLRIEKLEAEIAKLKANPTRRQKKRLG